MPRLKKPKILNASNFMQIEPATRKSLEIVQSINGDKKSTLFCSIDRTITACGGRLLSLYLSLPLSDSDAINRRLDSVEYFVRTLRLQKQSEGF